jgi:hypothetical protein
VSVRVMTAVWALALPDSEKIVLLALADCANDEGHCWPGMRSLIAKCSKSERTIQGAIQRLVDAGHLTRREVPGKGCNYTVHPRTDCAPAEAAPPQATTQTPAAAAGKPLGTVNTGAKAPYEQVRDLWNEESKSSGIPEVRVFNNSRKQMLNARVKEHGLPAILDGVKKIHASPFCRGLTGDGRKQDIMLLLQAKTCARVLEGFYGATETGKRVTDPEIVRQNRLALAELYDKMGRENEAEELRRLAA